jgi:YesN/AraC family two-component response regulator
MIRPVTRTVLTIDDESYIRDSFRKLLEDYDYTVFEAENGKIGLAVMQQENPDLVLVDMKMPELNELQFLEQATQWSPDTPIIIVSGAADFFLWVYLKTRKTWFGFAQLRQLHD